MRPHVGQIYCDAHFHVDATTGELKPKFLLVLAAPEGADVVARLLTSRYANLRPESPPCFHGDPYPGFFLGVLGGELGTKSWLDLRLLEDLDDQAFGRRTRAGSIRLVMQLPSALLRPALECAAGADDTSRRQERLIRDVLARLAY